MTSIAHAILGVILPKCIKHTVTGSTDAVWSGCKTEGFFFCILRFLFCAIKSTLMSVPLCAFENQSQIFLNLTVKLWLVWTRIKGEPRAVCDNLIIHTIACQSLWGTVRLSAVMLTLMCAGLTLIQICIWPVYNRANVFLIFSVV